MDLVGGYDVGNIAVAGGQDFTIYSSIPGTLTIANGIALLDNNYNFLRFGSGVTVNLNGPQIWDTKGGNILVSGQIIGTGPLTLVQTSGDPNIGGTFIFNNTGAGNTYTGGTTLGDGLNSIGVAFWNASPFGTGNVTVLTGATASASLIAHGTLLNIANNFTFSGAGATSIKSWDDWLTFGGTITLASNTILSPTFSQSFLPAPNQAGSIPMPGPITRNPIIFENTISETGGARTLTISGLGIAIFNGSTNTYTGGTVVNGSLVFGSAISVPASGFITVNGQGYVGFADSTNTALANFISSHVLNATSTGAIGIDTLPGNSTATFNDGIDLSSYYNTALRIGSATTGILNGTITLAAGQPYKFGNGGGTLYVQSALTASNGLTLQSTGSTINALTVYLRGNNTYSGTTVVSNGYLIFDGASAIPGGADLTAAGSVTGVGASYIGYTDLASTNPAVFLNRFSTPANTWGIIGFDTHAGNSTVSISSPINLNSFNDGVFIGTTTSAIIDATQVTLTGVTNGSNAPRTLRLTAAQTGVLTVNGNLADGAFPVSVMIGTPAISGAYSSGTVIMNGTSTYTGGTTINAMNSAGGITLGLGDSSALGTGALTITTSPAGSSGLAGIKATTTGINLLNPINLANPGPVGSSSSPSLYLNGTIPFTLSGNITSTDNTAQIVLFNPSALTVSLAGDNSGFLGSLSIYNGTLNLLSNYAAGHGSLDFGLSSSGIVAFGGAATTPFLYGITGESGSLVIPSGTNLTFDTSASATGNDEEFGGIISGAGSITVSAPTAASPQSINLYGANTYTGGTTVLDRGLLVLSTSSAAGTGLVTLNATAGGGIVLNSGVTFTNALTFTNGGLMGWGAFAPTGSPTLTFDTGKTVVPGIAGLSGGDVVPVGTLALNTDVVFANGGAYNWGLQDIGTPGGTSLLSISGNLTITAAAGGFNLNIFTYDSTNNLGMATLTLGTPYSVPILTTSGTISGFSASAFTIDATNFQNGLLSPTVFTLSQSGNTILLNFTPVPEPSTYVLLALGLSTLAAPLLRRRRS